MYNKIYNKSRIKSKNTFGQYLVRFINLFKIITVI